MARETLICSGKTEKAIRLGIHSLAVRLLCRSSHLRLHFHLDLA